MSAPPRAPVSEIAAEAWRRSPGPGAMSPQEVALTLGRQLRIGGDQALLGMIDGPVVVLDVDSGGSIVTLCGSAATRGAVAWGQLLVDESRVQPMCIARADRSLRCWQQSATDVLIVDIVDGRLTSVTIGDQRNAESTMRANLSQLRATVDAATCP